jgi:hypothetical protein
MASLEIQAGRHGYHDDTNKTFLKLFLLRTDLREYIHLLAFVVRKYVFSEEKKNMFCVIQGIRIDEIE